MSDLSEQLRDLAGLIHPSDREIIHKSADELEAKDKRIAELEGNIAASNGLKCPNCDDVGWFAIQTDYNEWEQQQCEFCYTVPDSIFNRRAAEAKENDV